MIGSIEIREELWQVLIMYDVGGKLINGIESMHVNSIACIQVKGYDSEYFMTDSGVRQVCIMSPWLFNVYMDAVIKELKMGIGNEVRFQEEGRE